MDKENPLKTLASIHFNRECDSNESDESDSQYEKHEDPRISISDEIVRFDDDEKFRINRRSTKSIRKSFGITNRL
jgi:hypothetical protein